MTALEQLAETHKEVARLRVVLERKRRMTVLLAAYGYEILNCDPFISDDRFDQECAKIDVNLPTGNEEMDAWFKKEFDACTGQWIHRFPYGNELFDIGVQRGLWEDDDDDLF